jgi:hypothetical protein
MKKRIILPINSKIKITLNKKISSINSQIVCNIDKCNSNAVLYDFTTNQLCRCKIHRQLNDFYFDNGIYKRWDGKYWREKCTFEGCKTRPTFGNPNDHIPQRCSKHKFGTDENLISKKCEFESCKTHPSFGDTYDQIPRRCVKHQFPTDEDLIHKRCEYEGCKTRPSFGDPNDQISRRCLKHKLETDEDVVSKKCEFGGCKTFPSFRDPMMGSVGGV